MDHRKAIDRKAVSLMLVLCAIWAMQQVAVKAAAPAMAPVLQLALRSGGSALLVGLLVVFRRETGALAGGTWKPGLAIGALFAIEFLFIGEGLRRTSASHMAIFLYTAPIFAALGLHLRLPEERLKPVQWGGIALAFAGVVVSFAGRASEGSASGEWPWLGDLLGLAAGMVWGATTLTIRFSRLTNAPATVTLLYQLTGAFVLLFAVALLSGQTQVMWTPSLVVNLALQTVVVSFLSYLTWFALLRVYLATRLGVLSFLTPILGVLFAVAILGETLDASFVLGALMVLAGVVLVSAHELYARRPKRETRVVSREV